MEILKRKMQGISLVDVAGEIDLYNAVALNETLRKMLVSGEHRIILNLQKVPYIDSTGVKAMRSLLPLLQEYQSQLKLVQLTPTVRKIFQLTRLLDLFCVFDSEAAAMAAFSFPESIVADTGNKPQHIF